MISLIIKHFIFERALDVFFNSVQKNVISFKARSIPLSNIKKVVDEKNGIICYSTYYEGKLIETKVNSEVIQDLKAMHSIDIEAMMIEALKFEAVMSTMGPEAI